MFALNLEMVTFMVLLKKKPKTNFYFKKVLLINLKKKKQTKKIHITSLDKIVGVTEKAKKEIHLVTSYFKKSR